MLSTELSHKAEEYLRFFCLELPTRRVGSRGNRTATEAFAHILDSFNFAVECPEFDCIDWTQDGVRLTAGGESFEAFASPYSLGCRVKAPLEIAASVGDLETTKAGDSLLLVRGELAREQLMPKNFPFYNPEEHQHIVQLLETKKPLAIIAATSRNPELAGGAYPFPLIEDGDFHTPSVFMTEEEGNRLAAHAGDLVELESRADRIPAKACNVVAKKEGKNNRRVVLTAHIDCKPGTPGALDNASGIVVLLMAAELLRDYNGSLGIEIVAINGEDYYSAGGEILYLQNNQGTLNQILININLDGVGYYQGDTAFSLYGCPDELASIIRKAMSVQPGIVEGEPWYQGDHMIFVQNQVPAMAITSHVLAELMAEITHTSKDVPELVDASRLAHVALALRDLSLELGRN